jgi:hypothetical protein
VRKTWLLLVVLLLLSCRLHPAATGRPGYPGQPGVAGGVTPPGAQRGGARSGFLVLRAHARQFTAGMPVYLVLVNGSDRTTYFSSCAVELERQEDGRWSGGMHGGGACSPVATPVPPNGFARQEVTLPSMLVAGRYRFRLELEAGEPGAQTTVLSNTFRVR